MPSAVASSSKRSRRAAFDDDGDSDGVVIAEASSNLRNESRKKARVSDAGSGRRKSHLTPREQSATSSEEDYDDGDQGTQAADALPTPPTSTQYEIMRDAGFKHLEHTEDDDTRATQRIQSRPTLIGENHAAFNGIIESITCYNFMCHERLHCDLGPLLNFIVGENGSGKSAILTAITLCLGGKASATNRGSNLQSFVKEGRDHAGLVVKIKNQGTDAYRPDQFGESIIVERWFTKSGSSGFRLKSETGQLISNKRSDVDDVVDYFCLQVDNPLNVLSQDNARQFLNTASPTTKYKYFVQGTQLEQLSNDYQLLQEYLEANETKLIEYQETIDILKERCEKAVKLRDAVTKNAEMRQKQAVYRNQLIWAQVAEQEDRLKEKQNAIDLAQQEIDRTQLLIEEKTEELKKVDQVVQEAKQELERIREEEGEVKAAETEAHDKFNDARKLLTDTHTQERDLHSNLQSASERVKEYQGKIREEEQRLEEINGGALTEKQKELQEAKQAEKDVQTAIDAHSADTSRLDNELASAENEERSAAGRLEQKKREVSAAEIRLRDLSQNRIDPLAGFDPKIPHLLKSIENDTGFSQKPIGPIGTLIQLTKPKWGGVIERYLGGNLSAFIAMSRSDQKRLQSHMDRLRMRSPPPILIAPRHSLSNLREPDSRFDTIMRVLKFDDAVVRDQLVILNQIEQIILIEKREEAEKIMFDGQPPPNVTACIAFHDTKREGLRLTNRGGGNMSTQPVFPDQNQKPRMKSDGETQISFQKDALEQLRAELRGVEASWRTTQQAAQRCAQAVARHRRRAAELQQELVRAEVRIEQVEAELDAFENTGGALQNFKEILADAQRQKDHYGNQYGELAVQKRELNKEVENLKQKLNDAKLATQDFKTKIAKAEDKLKRREESRRVILFEKNEVHQAHEEAKAGKTQAEASRDRQIAVVDDYTQKASEACPGRAYIPEGETTVSLERKYESLREQLRKIRNQLGASDEDIHARAAQAIQEYREQKQHHKNLTSLVDGLKQALNTRLEKWRYFQRLISAHSRVNFAYLLSERKFRGELLLDHKSKKLEIQVEPDGTMKNESDCNTKTLSGGEKSFSSICLLLAIWDAIGSPLRCLDEFDVFMDNVNRTISTNMLIMAARRSVGKQFILITPNAIEGRANFDKDVKIIRLTDPRQRTLADH
ncbi:hypothetical protein DL770_001340 [Monosporascus sp. CRB-9-2]|nr:hypothetical protein DL770_001340 [Monosporascus sp. CRB-9-2]